MNTIRHILLVLFFCALAPASALSYDGNITHPGLAKETARVYNLKYDPDLTPEEISALIVGAVREDISPRWINHFYDPSTGEGWSGEKMGAIGTKTARFLARVFVGTEEPLSSLEWMRNRLIQQRYSRYEGDRTLGRAFDEYLAGNKAEAYKTLGYILHLLQDASVPAHVRQDSHLGALGDGKDPYEEWTTKYKDSSLTVPGAENVVLLCDSIDDCFKNLARYTQENFLSRDTLGSYQSPTIVRMQQVGTEGAAPLYALFSHPIDGHGEGDRMIGITEKKRGAVVMFSDTVHAEYWKHLSEMAVATGARIIKLFHDEAPREKERREYPARLIRYDVSHLIAPMVSPIGELQKARDFSLSLLGSAGGFFNSILGEGEKPEFTVDLGDSTKAEKKEIGVAEKESGQKKTDKPKQEAITAVRVIDGDTIELSSGALVRYIGIDAPEIEREGKKAECFANEAKKRNETLVLGKAVRLERGSEEADRHGRLLRYVWVGDTLVNQKLVEEGVARAFDFGYPHFYTAVFAEKSLKAKSARLGIFGPVCASLQKTEKSEEQDEKNEQEGALRLAEAPEKLLISEVRAGSDEFVEIYNPSSRSVPLGAYYFAYYSSSRDRWSEPWRSKQFPEDAKVAPNGYYVIAFGDGAGASNWKPYSSSQLSDRAGTVALWFGDPKNTASRKIDAVGWGGVFLSEGAAASYSGEQESIIRFPDGADTDFNASDFRKTSKPTPGGANVFIGPASGGSGAQESTAPRPDAGEIPVTYPKLLITEIQIESPGNVHNEFVELYNPNDYVVDLTGWSVQKKTAGGASFETFAPKSLFEGKSIAKHSYFVIAHPSSTIAANVFVKADKRIASNNTIALRNPLKNPEVNIIDKIGWGSAGDCEGTCAVQPAAGNSIQRKMESGLFSDTDDNRADFEIRACPSPGALSAECVPASSPTSTVSTSTVRALSASYNPGNVSMTLSWELASSTEHIASFAATSTDIEYEIRALDSSGEWNNGAVFIAGAHGTSTERRIDEIGRKYTFAIKAIKNGAPENGFAVSNEIEAPSFFSAFYFYQNPLAPDTSPIIEAYYPSFPFVPSVFVPDSKYSAVEFILHSSPTSTASSPTAATTTLKTTYRIRCAPFIPPLTPVDRVFIFDAGKSFPCPGGLANTAFDQTEALEDLHFLVSADPAQTINDGDYLNIHFYSASGAYTLGYGTDPIMKLVAKDVTRYYFAKPTADKLREMHLAPVKPIVTATSVQERVAEPFVQIAFSTSTDADSLDKDIKYFLRITASSTATSTATSTFGMFYPFGLGPGSVPKPISGDEVIEVWATNLPPVFYPADSGTFKFSIRACDNFMNCSEESSDNASILAVPKKIVDIQPGDSWGHRIAFSGQGAATSTWYSYFGAAQRFTVHASIELKTIRVFLETRAPTGARVSVMRDKTSSSTAIYAEAISSLSIPINSGLLAIDIFPPNGTILEPGNYDVVIEAMPPDETASFWYLISRSGTLFHEGHRRASFILEGGAWQENEPDLAITVFGSLAP